MLKLEDKIEILKTYLYDIKGNYADSFKTDILFYFDEFEDIQNTCFKFLNKLNSKEDIHILIDNLTSKIINKFNEDEEQLSDFIFYSLHSLI
ncbi:MAG: hypothetical protein GY739_22105 [Mesoflavibacter sp.]|nr:hypothetical protein [Mesoflavibacter sp.]